MPVEVSCLTCGAEFKVEPSRLKKGYGKYCSRRCVCEDPSHPSNTNRKFWLSKKELIILYEDQKLTMKEIAQKLNMKTVSYWFKKYDIPTRKKHTAWNKGKSAKVLFTSASFDEDFSYIAGVIFGDGHITKNHYSIALSSTDRDFVEEFAYRLGRLLGKGQAKICQYEIQPYKKRYDYARHSHDLYNLLNRDLSEVMGDVKAPLYFLKGLFDSDGCVTFGWSKGHLQKSITLTSTNSQIIRCVELILKQYKIDYTIQKSKTKKKLMKDGHWLIPRHHYCFFLQIRKKWAIKKFAEIMPKLMPRKQRKLEQLLIEMEKIGGINPKTGKREPTQLTIQQQSEARCEWWKRNPQAKQRAAAIMSETMRKYYKNPANRRQLSRRASKQMTDYWKNPIYRELFSKASSKRMLECWGKT